MPWNGLNKRRFEGTHTTGNEANSCLASSYRSLANNSTRAVKSVGAKTVKLSVSNNELL